jgi:hypothetical protein
LSFTLDTTVPNAPGLALAYGTGASSNLITSDGTLTLSGVEPGATVEYSIDGGKTWSTNFTAVEGQNNVLVHQTDKAGNVSDNANLSFTLDTTVPNAPGLALAHDTGLSASDLVTKDGTLKLSGVETGATVEYSVDGGNTWSASFTAVEGQNDVLVHQTDKAGNVSANASLSFTLDTTVPEAPGLALAHDTGLNASDLITSNGTLKLSGIEDGATVAYSIDGGKTWSTSFTAVEGQNDVLVHQIDKAGNVSDNANLNFTLDTSTSTPVISTVVDTGNGLQISGTAEAGATVTVTSPSGSPLTIQAGADGKWSVPAPGARLQGSVSASATDVAGNTSGLTSVTIDVEVPIGGTDGSKSSPTVAMTPDGGYVVLWNAGSAGTFFQKYDAAGNAVGDPVNWNQPSSNGGLNWNAAMPCLTVLNNGNIVVTALEADKDACGVYYRVYSPSGDTLLSSGKVNGVETGWQVAGCVTALSNGGFVVTWGDGRDKTYRAYAQVYDKNGVAIGSNILVGQPGAASNAQMGTVAALKDGGFVVNWCVGTGSDVSDVYAQRYDAAGKAVGSIFSPSTSPRPAARR